TLTLTRSTSPTPTPTPTSTPTPTPTPGNNCPVITSSALPDTSGTVTIQTTNNRTDPVGETEFAFLDTSVSTDNPANDAPSHLFYHGINGSSWLDGFDNSSVSFLNSGATSTYTATLNNPNHLTSMDVNVSQFNGTWCTT